MAKARTEGEIIFTPNYAMTIRQLPLNKPTEFEMIGAALSAIRVTVSRLRAIGYKYDVAYDYKRNKIAITCTARPENKTTQR